MLRTDVEQDLRQRHQRGGRLQPSYEDYCFLNVPGTAASVLDVDVGPTLPGDVFGDVAAEATHVVVLVLDGLGWERWLRDSGSPFLSTLSDRGVVTPLTSIAPSSTASAITTVHTATPAAEHGVFGALTYVPSRERIVHTFSTSEPSAMSTTGASGSAVPAEEIIQADSIYPRLERSGVETRVVQPDATLDTDYANVAFRGATQIPVAGPADTAATLRRSLEAASGHTYTYVYRPEIDEVSHEHGGDSAAYHRALGELLRPFERELCGSLDAETAAEKVFIVTADHGMIDLEPGPAGSLDLRTVDGVYENLRRPGGNPGISGDIRLMHLHLRPGSTPEVVDALEAHDVTVYSRQAAENCGLFAPDASPGGRCGDVVITHVDRKLVHGASEKVVPYVGMHGGLQPREMLVPFGVVRGSSLARA